MAADPMDNPGFSIPTLQQYQQLMRQQAEDSLGPNAPPWAKMMQTAAFNFSRAQGNLTPQEKLVAQANMIQQQAVGAAASETDPAKNRLAQLTYMLDAFNRVGLSDLSAKIMPEYNALTQRQIELRKLGAEATSAEDKATVDNATMGANIDAPLLKNQSTQAQTAESQANTVYTAGAKTNEANASAAASRANAAEKANEYQNYVKPETGQMVTVLKSNARGRAALAAQGFVEDNINFNPQKTGDLKLPKNTQQDLFKSLIGSQTQLDNLTAAMSNFKDSYLTLPGKLVAGGEGVLDKAGVTLTPAMHADLTGYASFHSNAIKALNQYIHDLTGAQMSVNEAERLRTAVADPQKQGPAEFKATLRETVRGLLQVQARAKAWLDANGDAGGTPPTGEEWEAISMPAIPESQVDAYMRRLGVGPKDAPSASGTSDVRSKADAIIGK